MASRQTTLSGIGVWTRYALTSGGIGRFTARASHTRLTRIPSSSGLSRRALRALGGGGHAPRRTHAGCGLRRPRPTRSAQGGSVQEGSEPPSPEPARERLAAVQHAEPLASAARPDPVPPSPPPVPQLDPWLVPPNTASQRVADTQRQPMRLSALFEEFCHYLRVEKEATPRSVQTYRWCFGDFEAFVMQQVGGTVLLSHFTVEHCRSYQYDLAHRGLKTNTIRVRLATLSSFGKWAVRRDKLVRNPTDALTRPRKKARLPHVPRWATIEKLLKPSIAVRERVLVALRALGGLRRSEVVALDVGDVATDFGLRRVLGKGGHEASLPLPALARGMLTEYVQMERAGAAPTEPLFVVTFRTKGGKPSSRRMSGQRIWKIIKDLGRRVGVPELHPHALRHACGAEFLRRTHGNLRVVQEHLRHRDVQTTTVYTKITQEDLQQQLRVFDNEGESKKDSRPSPGGI